MRRLEQTRIPPDFDYADPLLNVTVEARQKLERVRPATLGQAGRISGVSPADLATLMVVLHARARRPAAGTGPRHRGTASPDA